MEIVTHHHKPTCHGCTETRIWMNWQDTRFTSQWEAGTIAIWGQDDYMAIWGGEGACYPLGVPASRPITYKRNDIDGYTPWDAIGKLLALH